MIIKICKRHFLLIISGVFTGLLQVWLTVPFAAFFSLIPLMCHVKNYKYKRKFYADILAFLIPYYFIQTAFLFTVKNLMELSFLIEIFLSALLVVAVTLWLTLLMFVPLVFYPIARRSDTADLLRFSALFVLGEGLSEYVPFLSFPWSGLWETLISEPLLIQPAALLGCRFLSFVILIINGLIALVFYERRLKRALFNAGLCAIILFANIGYSILHISDIKSDNAKLTPIKVMAAQDNVMGRDKNKLILNDAVNSYISIMSDNWQNGIDIVLLPETAVPKKFNKKSSGFLKLQNFAKEHNTTLLAGCFKTVNHKEYNAMYSVSSNGYCTMPYLKQILVPFGEKIPFASLFGLKTLSSGSDSNNHCLLTENGIKTANVICIESIYPSLTRQQVKNGGQLLCISTNDSWFGRSYARLAHFRHSVMRAIESGRYTIRAGNCGVSAIITPWGELEACEVNPIKTAICADVYPTERQNLYIKTGDIILIFGVVIIFKAILSLIFHRGK